MAVVAAGLVAGRAGRGLMAVALPDAPAGAWFADAAQLAAAFERAGTGQSLAYACGPWPLRAEGNATLDLVKGWAQARRATLTQQRDPRAAALWLHIVQKLPEPAATAANTRNVAKIPNQKTGRFHHGFGLMIFKG